MKMDQEVKERESEELPFFILEMENESLPLICIKFWFPLAVE